MTKSILAALSAILALTALSGQAAAGPRFADDRDGTGIVLVDGHYGRGGHRGGRGDDVYADLLPEGRIVRRLIRQGFVSIEDIRLRRDRYIVEAVRP
ncbi:MAG: hypothetical protein H7Y08_03490, partial [Rhizobiaceae bacterium]|nr:hypothetical protein [Rhizobiaceae bacterium]